jgi:hypothetical protein
MLVSAGGFAFYRKETYVFDLLPRFAGFGSPASREAFLGQFLNGYLGKVPGLDVEPLARRALAAAENPAAFLPRLMEEITRTQGMERWLEATPPHVLYMDEITRAVPDALFVHVIRDGRDCALSSDGQHWIATLPWDRAHRTGVAALYWEWMVRSGRRWGRAHPDRYIEVRFEDLVGRPGDTLAAIGRFIDHDLDYDRVLANPVHSLKKPNTSFREEHAKGAFNPVGRWKDARASEDVRLCEQLVGPYLEELGYARAFARSGSAWTRARLRACYMGYFKTKHLLKAHTPLGRIMTSTVVWSEQPKPNEPPVRPRPSATRPVAQDPQTVTG